MKKSKVLATTSLAGALLFTGVGHQAHAESKRPIHVFTEKQFNEQDKVGENDGYGGGPGSGVHIVNKGESYQDYLNRVKNGQALNEEASGQKIKYVYPKEAKDILNGNNSDNNQSKTTVVDTYQGDQQQQNNGQQTQATTQNNTQSQSTTLPKTGKEDVNSGLVTIIASVLLAAGSLLAFRRTSNSK